MKVMLATLLSGVIKPLNAHSLTPRYGDFDMGRFLSVLILLRKQLNPTQA